VSAFASGHWVSSFLTKTHSQLYIKVNPIVYSNPKVIWPPGRIGVTKTNNHQSGIDARADKFIIIIGSFFIGLCLP
jgi:hypothetical protein